MVYLYNPLVIITTELLKDNLVDLNYFYFLSFCLLKHKVFLFPVGEVTVKWVEGIQTKLPMCIGGGLLGAIRLAPK